MRYPQPLEAATLLRRYKRFLADVDHAGEPRTVHCANPGSMRGLIDALPSPCQIYDAQNPKRKLSHSLELIEVGGHWVCVNTGRTNALAEEALLAGKITEVGALDRLEREVKLDDSRLDFRVWPTDGTGPVWIEVKQVTLATPPLARFPDAQTARGRKHLDALIGRVEAGERAMMLYVITRGDCTRFSPADDIDPAYAAKLSAARDAGVAVGAYACDVNTDTITVSQAVEVAIAETA